MYILASRETMHDVIREHLGDRLAEVEQQAIVDDLAQGTALEWQEMPDGIHPDLGFNFDFLVCRDTCWLGRALDAGERFVVFRFRGDEAEQPVAVGVGTVDMPASR